MSVIALARGRRHGRRDRRQGVRAGGARPRRVRRAGVVRDHVGGGGAGPGGDRRGGGGRRRAPRARRRAGGGALLGRRRGRRRALLRRPVRELPERRAGRRPGPRAGRVAVGTGRARGRVSTRARARRPAGRARRDRAADGRARGGGRRVLGRSGERPAWARRRRPPCPAWATRWSPATSTPTPTRLTPDGDVTVRALRAGATTAVLTDAHAAAVAALARKAEHGTSGGRRTSSGRSSRAGCCCCSRARSRRWPGWPIPTAAAASGTTATSPRATAASPRRSRSRSRARVYEEVYRQFCRHPGRAATRASSDHRVTFETMLGLGARPRLLQPGQLVPRAGAAARLLGEPPVHGADDGRPRAAARRGARGRACRPPAGTRRRRAAPGPLAGRARLARWSGCRAASRASTPGSSRRSVRRRRWPRCGSTS